MHPQSDQPQQQTAPTHQVFEVEVPDGMSMFLILGKLVCMASSNGYEIYIHYNYRGKAWVALRNHR